MKNIAIIIFLCLTSVIIFAQDLQYVIPIDTPENDETIYVSDVSINIRTLDLKNKITCIITNDINGYELFLYNFRHIWVEEEIARDTFSRQNFKTEELYNICRELRERGMRNPSVPEAVHIIRIVCNEEYGFLVWDWYRGGVLNSMARYFFKIKTE